MLIYTRGIRIEARGVRRKGQQCSIVHSDKNSDSVVPLDGIDPGSDGIVEIRVNDALKDLGLCYAGLDDGRLLLADVSANIDELTDDVLMTTLAGRLDDARLRAELGLKSFRIASRH